MSDFVVYEWMLGRELDLGKCELVILGLVFSYSRTGMTMYKSEQSLADYAGVSKRTVCTAIKKLMDQGLIVRSKEKHPKYRTYEYTVSEEVRRKYFNKDGENISPMSVKKFHQEQSKIFTDAGEKSSPNKIVHCTIDNPRYKEEPQRVKRKTTYGTATNPALEVGDLEDFLES
jgi:predicted transcriptional regulator